MSRKGNPASGGSWRDIQQANRRKKSTKAARRRRLLITLRVGMGLLLLAAIGAGILGIHYFSSLTGREEPSLSAHAMAEVRFQSDGVLTGEWFRERFGEFLRTDVREIDVAALKDRLEEAGQVATASVTVRLPSLLKVRVTERVPILRARVRGRNGRPELLLLARDGTLYGGAGYPEDTLRRLPGVAGLKIHRTGSGFAPVEGIESVAHLLEHAKRTLPSVYRHWRLVDLSDWNPEAPYRPSLVRIRSSHIQELVFSTEDIESQIERLAGILEHTQRYQMGQPVFIDLSYGEEAIIRYD